MHRYASFGSQPSPSLKQGNAGLQPLWPHVRLQVDVVGAQPRDQIEHRLQIVDTGRIALRLPDHPVRAKESGRLLRETRIDEPDTGAVEAGVADHRELGL